MFDVAIIGSGFGGALLACVARRLGRTVVMLEKGRHPRFTIGESSTPLADLLWLELTRRYGLERLEPFAKWGTWRATYPEVACGLKRGFSFYHHALGRPFENRPDRGDQLLVAASPRDEIADTHWYRPDFDHFLVREAVGQGVDYREAHEVVGVDFPAGGDGASLRVRNGQGDAEIRARFVVDASQHRGPLVRSLGLEDRPLPHFPRTEALYTHFRGVKRLGDLPLHAGMEGAPFPVDDAAVHHVFDGGWIWVLRFGNGITSAGVAAEERIARRFCFEDGATAWERLKRELPTVGRQFEDATAAHAFVHARGVAFRTGPAAGRGWALLPSAAGFVDPMLSSGFTLTLLGIERLARAMETVWGDEAKFVDALGAHAHATEAELLALEEFVSALYARLGDFGAFTEVARLYFCAVIWAETARRLGRSESEGGFLAKDHGELGRECRSLCGAARAGQGAGELRRRVDEILARFDLGGLGEPGRRPWYPVLASDLRVARGRMRGSDEAWAELERQLVGPLRPG